MPPSNPTPEDIFRLRLFQVPLVPIGADPTPIETAALSAALQSYSKRTSPDDFSSLTGFIQAHPQSSWNAALLTNLGLEYYNTGHYSQTLDVWGQAWQLARTATDVKGKAIADCAVGELAYMHARLGHMMELEALLKTVEGRAFMGSATEKITGAREGLWNMKHRPEVSFRCGPLALHRIKLSVDPKNPGTALIHASASTQKGFSLPQVAELSKKLSLNFQMAFREKGAKFVVPSVLHLKVDHYAAIIRQEGDRYLLQDPTFGNDVWVTREALEDETSGYFLIPAEKLARGWRVVEEKEGETVWGKGFTCCPDPGPNGPCDHNSGSSDPCCNEGMAVPRVHLMLVSLNINDSPVGYSPPVGPAIRFTVRYNQRDAFQPPIFTYSNLGLKWTFDWLSYITDNPTSPSADVSYYIMGGGTRTFIFDNSTGTWAIQQYDQTKLTRTSGSSYEMLSPDGTRKVFSQSDGATGTSRKIFLTQVFDPSGNAVSLTYDANLRMVTITDAISQVTTLSYENPNDIYKITKVTDPFGRFATFTYDASGRLTTITDVIGITSQFGYDAGDFINQLITPYGVTTFTKSEMLDANGNLIIRSLETVYPDGNRDRVEYNINDTLGIPGSDPPQSVPGGMATRNAFLTYRNTFYWSKKAYADAYPDYAKAKIYHWLHTLDLSKTAGILESVKEPLEGRVWYDYAGQSNDIQGPAVVGSTNKPGHVGRVLDDGSTQLYTYEYNDFGHVTKAVDPVGRTFSYHYAANGIDLLQVRQTRAGQNELLLQRTYNNQHLPLTSTDAAGQTTTYTYNVRGQVLTVTNPKNETTTYSYDANGYLISIQGPLPGSSATFTYDSFGRRRTETDESGYTRTYDYDVLDRRIKMTYPDSTFAQFTYDRLDQSLFQDRAGRQTLLEYNSVRQMTKRTDPLNRVTLFQWCTCGALWSLTDPLGRTTTWRRDIQGRIKYKEYVDGSKVTYLYEKTTSRLRQRIDEKLQVTQYNYNNDDTLSRKSYSNALVPTPSVAFTYDPNYRQLSSMTDGQGTTHYHYIPITPVPTLGAGQLASEEGPLPNHTITYTYDELGRRVARAIDGVSSSFVLDAEGRVASETNALGTFDYAYDGASTRRLTMNYPNGLTATSSYFDTLGDLRLEQITYMQGAMPISDFGYGYDVPTGRISAWSQQSDSQAPFDYTFGYDAGDQLTSASGSQNGSVIKSFAYTYDPAGNRLTAQVNGVPEQFSYNALNELTTADPAPGVSAVYQWDAEHRLVAVRVGRLEVFFEYDGFGRRVVIRRQLLGRAGIPVPPKHYIWSGSELCEERNIAGAVVKRYFSQGMRLELGAAAGNYFYIRDHLGSIRELVDEAGNVQARYDYDPFGARSRIAGNLESDFGFTGHFYDAGISLCLTKFREYEPATGRWLSRDLLKDAESEEGPNLYTYVHNDPANRVDTLGLGGALELGNVDDQGRHYGWGVGSTMFEALAKAEADCASTCPGSKVAKKDHSCMDPHGRGESTWACSVRCWCKGEDRIC